MAKKKSRHRPEKWAGLRWDELVDFDDDEEIGRDLSDDDSFGLEEDDDDGDGDFEAARFNFERDRWQDDARSSNRYRSRQRDFERDMGRFSPRGRSFDPDFPDLDDR